ncbi:MAG: glycosyltransferase family A protein, partial [Deltaproteobacteria bacterium]
MITAVITRGASLLGEKRLEELLLSPLIRKVLVLDTGSVSGSGSPLPPRCEALAVSDLASGASGPTWNALLTRVATQYLLYVSPGDVRPDPHAPSRLYDAAVATGAGVVYADYTELRGGNIVEHPVNDYQMGSIRDGFDFGPIMLISTSAARRALRKYGAIPPCRWAGWYDLRLKLSTDRKLFHLPEPLSMVAETGAGADGTGDGDKAAGGQFTYVDPKNRAFQEEMETVATAHLHRIGAWIAPLFRDVPQSSLPFPVEASVVIPVRNRARTVADAVKSALAQRTDFPFNVIVVDNHSTDGTTAILADLTCRHPALKHIVPERLDLSIGGCWNEAIFSKACGCYAVQLDSDDLYQGDDVLQRLVDLLRQGNCALVVGAYTIVDGNLREIPPGLIDHREWTD